MAGVKESSNYKKQAESENVVKKKHLAASSNGDLNEVLQSTGDIDVNMSDDEALDEVNEDVAKLRFAPTIKRRRSSNYRPSYFYDQSTVRHLKDGVNLEMLPMIIIARIFSHLLTPDLLNICVASRLLYVPAVIHLYNKIMIIDRLKNQQLYEFLKITFDGMYGNFGTVCKFLNLPKLINVLNNQKLANHVRLVLFVDDSLDFENEVNLRHLIRLTFQVSGLTELVNPSLGVDRIHRLSLSHLTKLTVCLRRSSQSTVTTQAFNFPLLKNLTVLYENDDANKPQLEKLAESLVQTDVLSQLLLLEFKQLADVNLKLLNETNNNNTMTSIWTHFFYMVDYLSPTEKKYGNLQKLSVDGSINDHGVEISRILQASFQLANLKHLNLDITEFSHLNEPHYENNKDLLINMAQKCETLEALSITPTYNCLKCQLNLVINSLNLLSGQLRELYVKFETLNLTHTKSLYHTILESQPNLQKLVLYDKSNEFNNGQEMSRYIPGPKFAEFERGNFNIELLIKNYPTELTFEQHIQLTEGTMKMFYQQNHDSLVEYLEHYLQMFELDLGKILTELQLVLYMSINNMEIIKGTKAQFIGIKK